MSPRDKKLPGRAVRWAAMEILSRGILVQFNESSYKLHRRRGEKERRSDNVFSSLTPCD